MEKCNDLNNNGNIFNKKCVSNVKLLLILYDGKNENSVNINNIGEYMDEYNMVNIQHVITNLGRRQ